MHVLSARSARIGEDGIGCGAPPLAVNPTASQDNYCILLKRLLIGEVGGPVCGFDINGADCYPLDYLQPLVDAAGNEGCLHHMTLKTNTQGKQE